MKHATGGSNPPLGAITMNQDQYKLYKIDRQDVWDQYIEEQLNDKENPLRIFSLDMAYLLMFGGDSSGHQITHPSNEKALEKFLIDRGYDKIIIRSFNNATKLKQRGM